MPSFDKLGKNKEEGMFPLSDIKVVELSSFIAGPYCAKLLADWGAHVIKVEEPPLGDEARRSFLLAEESVQDKDSSLFLYLNTNKKSITLNLECQRGKAIFLKLVQDADILLESFPPGHMRSLGLSYKNLREVNPKLIVASISNFGQYGPYRDYEAAEISLQALSGMLLRMGKARPTKYGGYLVQHGAGLIAFIAILTSLLNKGDEGQYLDLSLIEAGATGGILALLPYVYMGLMMKRGLDRSLLGSVGIYPASNGYVVFVPGYGGMESLALLLGRPELMEDPLFVDPIARQLRAEEFAQTFILPWLKEHRKEEVFEQAQELGMPFGLIQTVPDLLDDLQLQDREFFLQVAHPVVGELIYPSTPFKSNAFSYKPGRAPLLGEHNGEIYSSLGYGEEEVEELQKAGVI